MKKFLIVGANLDNKGAESMLFIAVDEIKKRFPTAEVYYAGLDIFDSEKYAFSFIYYSFAAKKIALGEKVAVNVIKSNVKDIIKAIVGKRNNLWQANSVKNLFAELSAVIDVSGFNLGEKWDISTQEGYLDNIRLAKKYNVPIYLMPQSFGPFNYTDEKKYLLDEIKELLRYPAKIYAREEAGKKALEETFGLSNVSLSTDLVLQNKSVDPQNIYNRVGEINLPEITSDGNVAIIPNKQCFNFGNKDKLLSLYDSIIRELLNVGKTVYIFRHSVEDLPICKMIKEMFRDEKNVMLIERDFTCLEYDEYIKNFDFIICSRFHGIVHAYRNSIPSIALGWAVKYKELAEKVNQGKYAVDITEPEGLSDEVMSILSDMLQNYRVNSKTIFESVKNIQKDNCFDILDELGE